MNDRSEPIIKRLIRKCNAVTIRCDRIRRANFRLFRFFAFFAAIGIDRRWIRRYFAVNGIFDFDRMYFGPVVLINRCKRCDCLFWLLIVSTVKMLHWVKHAFDNECKVYILNYHSHHKISNTQSQINNDVIAYAEENGRNALEEKQNKRLMAACQCQWPVKWLPLGNCLDYLRCDFYVCLQMYLGLGENSAIQMFASWSM